MPVRPLSPELAEKARVELFEDPKKLEDSLQHLKEWIAKQPHLRARTDDQWLAAFLRGCKFSMERTKEKIDLFYSLRTIASDLFALKPKDPKFMEILKKGALLILPKTENPAGPRGMIMNIGVYGPNELTPNEMMSVIFAIQNILYLEDDNFIVAGGISVMDLKNTAIAHFTSITPLQIKKMVVAAQDAAPVRMKEAHYFYMPAGMQTFFNLAKTFFSEKNKKRMYIHGKDVDSLSKYISKDVLPAEYGGNGGTIQEIIDYWVKKIEEYSDWFEEDEQYGTDEARRPGKPKSAEDMFGVEGSFRQLQFD